jgi:hypothetical protein
MASSNDWKTYLSDVTRRSQTQTTDQTGAHVGQDITVQVGHDHDSVSIRCRVLNDSQTCSVQQVLVVGDVGVVLGDSSTSLEEHAVGHLHDVGLVDGGDLVSAVLGSVVEGVSGDSLRGLVGDQLDRLDDAVDDLRSGASV